MIINLLRQKINGLDLPSAPDGHYGPEKLVELLLESRRIKTASQMLNSFAPISDSGIEKLVTLSYYASLLPEEGRYPSIRIICRSTVDSEVFVKFKSIELENAETLRRLAPACSAPNLAIIVSEDCEKNLWCEGLVDFQYLGVYRDAKSPYSSSFPEGRPIFRIEVCGPAWLRVGEGIVPSYELHSGRLRELGTFRDSAVGVTNEFNNRLRTELAGSVDPNKIRFFESTIVSVLQNIIRDAVVARHGGAFVFIPADRSGELSELGLTIKYPVEDLDLGATIIDWCRAYSAYCEDRYSANGHENSKLIDECRFKLHTQCNAVSGFSAVDGCVVMTYDMRVVGFGAKITVSKNAAEESPRKYKNRTSGEVIADTQFYDSIGGTRHQSAARYCQGNRQSTIYTVSQDGEVKLFCSDNANSFVFGPIHIPTGDCDFFTE